jgi:hypothetical protein
MLRWVLRRTVKPVMLRLRWYMQADVMAELAALRGQLGTADRMDDVVRSLEAAVLTLAVLGESEE